ncbi:MFS transporter, CP family, cyanate transporter [Nonomuraea maritima]|uniref:MFS transporter, CP family, cyanate transporter n=1 Tax=Nonomuraea maritima TaxID=683260 RepID=A0A1G8V9U1_9ACTN|nr:MFS transporter [Nonomuraea maritima]SDJ62886.1 MFS transporter, CP family, cyanate transporter [Nonomuraea maritima]
MSFRSVLLLAGFVLAALNLRPAIAGVSPLLDEIMDDVGLTPAGGGAITTVMVVCLGLFGPVTPLLARRFGLDRTLLAGLLVIATGLTLRGLGGAPVLYLGSALAATAIAVMNVSMPGIVKQHFPTKVNLMTGVYVSMVVAGAAASSALVIPLEHATGYGWRGVSALLAVPALLAALLWLPQAVRRPEGAGNGPRPFGAVLRSRVTWYVTALMGLQSLTFYVMLAWLPTIYLEAGLAADQAGYLLSLTNLVQVGTSLAVPVLAGRRASQVPYVMAACVLTVAGYLGVLLAPMTVPWLWMVVLGIGQGASFALALLIIALRPANPAEVTALSAVAQSVGYVIAALGPLLFGLLRQASGGWTVPLVTGLVMLGAQLVAGWFAGRPAVLVKASLDPCER